VVAIGWDMGNKQVRNIQAVFKDGLRSSRANENLEVIPETIETLGGSWTY